MNNKGVRLQLLLIVAVVTVGFILATASAEAFYDVSGNWVESLINTLPQHGINSEIDTARLGGQNARLMLNFNQLVLPTQQTLQVVAEVNTKPDMPDAATLTNALMRSAEKPLAGAVAAGQETGRVIILEP